MTDRFMNPKLLKSEELPDTFSIENAYFASPESLLIFLEDLIRGQFGNVFRAKGQLPAGSHWFQFDVADSRYGITGCEPLKTGKAVFIGTNIQRQPIRHVALNKMIQKKITWKKDNCDLITTCIFLKRLRKSRRFFLPVFRFSGSRCP